MCRLIRRLVEGLPVSITECVDGREALARAYVAKENLFALQQVLRESD